MSTVSAFSSFCRMAALGFCLASSGFATAQSLDPLSFTSLGSLDLSGGNFTIDTDAMMIVDDSAPGTPLFTGVSDDQNGTADYFNGVWVPGSMGIPEIAVFAFDGVNLQSTANITVTGTRALAFLSQGNVMIDTTIDLTGEGVAAPAGLDPAPAGVGRFGGFSGGFTPSGPSEAGEGPGGGPGGSFAGASGGFGGPGFSSSSPLGSAYGDLVGGPLQGGSGGGSVNSLGLGGAAGGGALEISAIGSVTLSAGGNLIVAGGMVEELNSGGLQFGGGGGSGGGIRIQGQSVDLLGSVDALAFFTIASVSSRAGGGRVAVFGLNQLFDFVVGQTSTSSINTSTINVDGGCLPFSPSSCFAGARGLISISPQVTTIPPGETLTLGQVTDLSDANRRLELVHHNIRVQQGGEAVVPIEGYVNSGKIELFAGGSTLAGPGTLDNRSELSGSGTVEAAVNNNASGTIDAINDVLTFTAAVTNNVGGQINAINSTLSFDAGLTNNGEMNLINSNIVGSIASAATSSATLVGSNSVSGNYTMGAGNAVNIGLGGMLAGEFDTLSIGGDAILAGNLNVALDPGFTPSAGDTFEILTATNVISVFDTVNLPALTGDLLWFVNYGATSVELVSTYGADFDEDGIVDGNDLTAWEAGFGSSPATHMTGDANADSAANGFDFLTWQRQFGNGGAPLAASATIPEPATVSLLLMSLITVLRKRCQRRS